MSLCLICQGDKSSKKIVLEPGCCGRWLHLDCLKLVLSAGGSLCPACSTPFPPQLMSFGQPAAVTAIPVAVAAPPDPIVINVVDEPPPAQTLRQKQPYTNLQQQQQLPPQIPIHRNRGHSTRSGGVLDARNKLEDPIEPWVPVVISDSSSLGIEGSISSRCIPEVPELATSSVPNFHGLVSLYTSGQGTSLKVETRPPLDIVCVLDTSGSMGSDHKLENLKSAVDYIRGELNDNDRLSVITFSSSSILQHNLLRMNGDNKIRTQQITHGLRAAGGTCILSGLQSAYQTLSSRRNSNPVTSVFLLTDGIDSSNLPEKQRTAKLIKDLGSSLFVFGFGADHDSHHLQAIADAGDGMFTYIERSDMVVDAFGGALGAELSIFATNIELHLTACPGTQIVKIESGVYANQIASDGTAAVISYKNLMIGEERDVLVTLNISGVTEELDSQSLLKTTVRYHPLLAQESGFVEMSGDELIVKRLSNDHLSPAMMRNELIDVQLNRLILTSVTRQAMDFADQSNYAQARRILQEALENMRRSSSIGNIRTQGFIQELELTLRDVSSEIEFRSGGGRSNMSEKAQNYSRQRMCYAKSASPAMYQNSVSCEQQSKASLSKARR